MNNITKKHEDLKSFGLVVFGIVLNLVCGKIVGLLNLPFYFDCIGTIAAAITGGFMPGVLVGFFTNILSGITDYTNLYYGVLNVLIALVAAFFSQKLYFKKITWKIIIPIIAFVLIGGGIGSVITWGLYGNTMGRGDSRGVDTLQWSNHVQPQTRQCHAATSVGKCYQCGSI